MDHLPKSYRLPRVVSPAIVHRKSGKVFVLPRPYGHTDIVLTMHTRYGIPLAKENVDKDFTFGWILETGALASRLLAAECAEENGQTLTNVDLSKGLFAEHLVQ